MLRDFSKQLAGRIEADGPMPFWQWMEACLYDSKHGYYMQETRRTGAGPDADFVTPPSLHPFVGTAVAREIMAHPGAYSVTEYGGGEGALARAAMAEFGGKPGTLWQHVEKSPRHRRLQQDTDARIRHGDGPTHWGVLCEVLDAIPGDVLAQSGQPARVAFNGAFTWETRPARTDSSRAASWLAKTAAYHQWQQILVIDYPGPAPDPRGYRKHAHADVLQDPGETDITLPVDFDQVAATMEAAGYTEIRRESLESFVLRHGILEALNATPRDTQEGASAYLRLRQLLLPTGLGGAFKVAIYAKNE